MDIKPSENNKTAGLTDLKCSFCGKNQREVEKLIAGPTVCICNECVELCVEIIEAEDLKKAEHKFNELGINKIRSKLDEIVVGHDKAKFVLAFAAWNHVRRIHSKSGKETIPGKNILLIGPTGTGKALLAETLADIINVPFVVADAARLLQFGAGGVNAYFELLWQQSKMDINWAQKGLVYIDNIDKIVSIDDTDALRKERQSALLGILDGATLPVTFKRTHPAQERIMLDTSNMLFIAGGQFRTPRNTGTDIDDCLNAFTHEDLISQGFTRELASRFRTIVTLDHLTETELLEIIKISNKDLLKPYEDLFEVDGVKLMFEKDAIDAIARVAYEKNLGVRGLESVLQNLAIELSYDLHQNPDIKEITVSKKLIEMKFRKKDGKNTSSKRPAKKR